MQAVDAGRSLLDVPGSVPDARDQPLTPGPTEA
jgi:hypothetical protein